MINLSINIACSIAEMEASAAGSQSILPNHFWVGCCKGCDLDFPQFLQNAQPELRNQEVQIPLDFDTVREAHGAGKIKPSALRRALRSRRGKNGKSTPQPFTLASRFANCFRRRETSHELQVVLPNRFIYAQPYAGVMTTCEKNDCARLDLMES